MYSGPHIKRDGLVFGYDTGYGIADNSTATRFYPGKPTENLLALAGADTDLERSGDGSGYSYHGVNITSYVQSRWSSSNNRLVQSFEGKRDYSQGGTGSGGDGYPRMYVYFSDWSWSASFGITSYDWSYNKQIFTMPNPAGKTIYMNIYHMNNGNPGRSYSRKHSVAFNTIDTPYSNGTRSSTQSLIDLTKTRNIDVSNVSFDSNGLPTFDGTDDEINTGITTQLVDFSCVVVFKNNSSASWGRLVDKQYTTGFFISSYFYSGGSGYVGAGIIEPSYPHGQSLPYDISKYNYFVVTRSGTTHTIYLNGSTNSLSKTGSGATLSSNEMAIGAWNGSTSSQRHTGEIPVVKLYNRALTPNEIQQDFTAYKNRFDI